MPTEATAESSRPQPFCCRSTPLRTERMRGRRPTTYVHNTENGSEPTALRTTRGGEEGRRDERRRCVKQTVRWAFSESRRSMFVGFCSIDWRAQANGRGGTMTMHEARQCTTQSGVRARRGEAQAQDCTPLL